MTATDPAMPNLPADRVREEIRQLTDQKNLALQNSVYFAMTTAEAREYYNCIKKRTKLWRRLADLGLHDPI